MDTSRFNAILDALAKTAHEAADVVGLVAFGSTATTGRADEWSDHDFAWITTDAAAAERYRHDISWLPNPESIQLKVLEHHGGVKVIYDNGHRMEFGIADLAGFATWAGSPARVITGDAAIHEAVAGVVARRPEGTPNSAREIRLFLTQLLAGEGRAQRGETLSASALVRFEAVNHLLRAVNAMSLTDSVDLDPLDPRRRFELAHPELGGRLEAVVRLPVVAAIRELLEIAEGFFEGWSEFPRDEFSVVRRVLGN